MTLKPEAIEGLRNQFIAGATFSGLLRYLLDQHSGEQLSAQAIQLYFAEAFSIPFFGGVKKDASRRENDRHYATIDTWLITRVISTSDAWLQQSLNGTSQSFWWNDLDLNTGDQFSRGKPEWLSEESWGALSSVEQERIAAAVTSCEVLSQDVLVLARLAEELQRQLSDLQRPTEVEVTAQHDQ